MKAFYIFLGLTLFSIASLIGQSSVYGKITIEESGEKLIYANIVLNKNGVFAAGSTTDFEGNYSIPLDPGTYEMTISYTGFPNRKITGVIIKRGQETKLDIKMEPAYIIHCYLPRVIESH